MSTTKRATLAAVTFAVALGAAMGPGAGDAFAQRTRPLTRKERERREQEKKDAARKEQERKDSEAAAAAAEEERKKQAAAAAAAPPPPPPAPLEEKKEWDDSVEAPKAIFVSAELAFTRSDLAVVLDTTAFDRTSANGVLFGLAGGLRLGDWRFGGRWRTYDTTEFTLWNFAISAGYALKLRPVTPIFTGYLGYVFDQSIEPALFKTSLPEGTVLPPDVDVKGLLLGADANASYWVTKWFRMGAFLGVDFMFLSRATAPLPQSVYGPSPEVANRELFREGGFGLGLNFNAGFRGSFDIGIE